MSFNTEAGQSELALRHLAWSLLKERSFHITARKMLLRIAATHANYHATSCIERA